MQYVASPVTILLQSLGDYSTGAANFSLLFRPGHSNRLPWTRLLSLPFRRRHRAALHYCHVVVSLTVPFAVTHVHLLLEHIDTLTV
jgi:hypothetical protein